MTNSNNDRSRLNIVWKAIDNMERVRVHIERTRAEMGDDWAAELTEFHEANTRAAIDSYMEAAKIDDAGVRASLRANLMARAGLA